MTNGKTDPTDCWGCAVRAKLHRALGLDPATPVEAIVNAVLGELTLAELCQCAGEKLREWAEDERPVPRRRRMTAKASGPVAP